MIEEEKEEKIFPKIPLEPDDLWMLDKKRKDWEGWDNVRLTRLWHVSFDKYRRIGECNEISSDRSSRASSFRNRFLEILTRFASVDRRNFYVLEGACLRRASPTGELPQIREIAEPSFLEWPRRINLEPLKSG